MANRIKLYGEWYPLENLSEYPVGRIGSSVGLPRGTAWQITFGTTILELTPEQGMDLKAWLSGITG